MAYDPNIHHRHSIRLKDYDYSMRGFYFVTICSYNHIPRFGKIIDGTMQLNGIGRIVLSEWELLQNRFPHIICREHVVMPNHFHGIIQIASEIDPQVGAPLAGAQEEMISNVHTGHPQGAPLHIKEANISKVTLGEVIGAFKSITTNRILKNYDKIDLKIGRLWQRNFYEHVIRNQHSYDEIAEYIRTNPLQWENDKLYRHG